LFLFGLYSESIDDCSKISSGCTSAVCQPTGRGSNELADFIRKRPVGFSCAEYSAGFVQGLYLTSQLSPAVLNVGLTDTLQLSAS
jgi:hypothetical protein